MEKPLNNEHSKSKTKEKSDIMEEKPKLHANHKTTEDIIYKDELEQKQKENPNLTVKHFDMKP